MNTTEKDPKQLEEGGLRPQPYEPWRLGDRLIIRAWDKYAGCPRYYWQRADSEGVHFGDVEFYPKQMKVHLHGGRFLPKSARYPTGDDEVDAQLLEMKLWRLGLHWQTLRQAEPAPADWSVVEYVGASREETAPIGGEDAA